MRLRYAALGVLILMFLVAATASATTWYSYRNSISVDSGTTDINRVVWANGTTTQTYTNITFPCEIGDLDNTNTQFDIMANGANIQYSLTVNGVSIKTNQAVTSGSWDNTTLQDWITAGVSSSDTYLNFTYSVDVNSNVIKIVAYGDDSALLSSWLSSQVSVKERDVTTPEIKTSSTKSFWTVNDSITVTNNMAYTLSDVKLNLTYPSNKVTEPVTQKTISSISSSGSETTYVQYQKYGPYVFKVKDDSSGTSHKVYVYVKSYGLLTKCVNWDLNPSDSIYKGYFSTLDTNSLTVKLNNVDVDYTIDSNGHISMEDLTLKQQYSQNKFEFSWQESAAAPTTVIPTEAPWYEQTIGGLPVWMVLAVFSVMIISIVVAATIKI